MFQTAKFLSPFSPKTSGEADEYKTAIVLKAIEARESIFWWILRVFFKVKACSGISHGGVGVVGRMLRGFPGWRKGAIFTPVRPAERRSRRMPKP